MGGDVGMEGVYVVIVGRRRDNEVSSDWFFMFGWVVCGRERKVKVVIVNCVMFLDSWWLEC